MVAKKKTGKRKITEKKEVTKEPEVKIEIVQPKQAAEPDFKFEGEDQLKDLLGGGIDDVKPLIKKFQNRFGFKLRYVPKFKAFKIFKSSKHVDWITLNDLMKRYDCRIPPVKSQAQIQRPYAQDRAY